MSSTLSVSDIVKLKSESDRIRYKFPDRVPIMISRHPNATKDLPDIDRTKFLVPGDLTILQLLMTVRSRAKINAAHALFLTVKVPSLDFLSTATKEEKSVVVVEYVIKSLKERIKALFSYGRPQYVLPVGTATVAQVDHECKDRETGFLYVDYIGEDFFGDLIEANCRTHFTDRI